MEFVDYKLYMKE